VRLRRRHQVLAAVVVGAAVLAAVAAVALSRSIEQGEYRETDARLSAELAGAVRAVEGLATEARGRAVRLAASSRVQRAFALGDRQALQRIAAASGGVAFEADGVRVAGPARSGALAVSAAVVHRGGEIGRVVVEIPVQAVAAETALAPGDRLVAGRVDSLAPSPTTLTIEGRRYRAISTAGGPARLTALAPHDQIVHAVSERRRRVLLALAASFGSIVLLAFLAVGVGHPTRRRLRRTGDRPPKRLGPKRTREAAELVGNALAAGHDVDALLPVILETAVTVTGAVGARLVADGEELASVGSADGGPPLALALSAGPASGGLLVLYPPPGGAFDDEAVQLAEWLAGRASIALQNAHLHRLARQLATTDELTQLANRRQFDEALAAEVIRAERFRDPVAVVVADLDNFKDVNDRFGHDVGDLVLRAFAGVIRENVRDVDLPARYGGEEFTVLLPATDAEGGRQLAERLRRAAEELTIDVGSEATVSVRSSFGVASFPAEPSAAALMRAGDRALYRAKAAGKNTVVVSEGMAAAS
jgi:diguanylate cyclase (GGDEF)-like protein